MAIDYAPEMVRPAPTERGFQHVMHPSVLGPMIGGVGASTFVFINRGQLPGAWPTYSVLAWAVAVALCAYIVFLHPRRLHDPGPPRPGAGLTYTLSVAGMLAVMALGMWVLNQLGRPDLQPGVVVTAVGLHFIPFARAFNAPVFARQGASLTAIGVLGVLLGATVGGAAAAGAAVLTGIVMLLVMASDAYRGNPVR